MNEIALGMNFFQIKSFIKYCIKSRYRKGYGLHSPFVFELVRDVFYCQYPFYAFDEIKAFKRQLVHSNETFEMVDYGAGSVNFNGKTRKLSSLARRSSIASKYGELIFRLITHLNPDNILELGTSIGMSASYFALADRRREVNTIEGCSVTAGYAKRTFDALKCDNVNQFVGQFTDVLPELVAKHALLDFVFFDGHHEKQATLDYFNLCLLKAGNNSVFVFDDIHWSKGMEEAWEIIYKHPKVTVSIDLFQVGIVFFRQECQKQHFVVKY